jgi:hypothetical protein
MTMEDFRPTLDPRLARIQGVVDLYLRSLSFVFLLLGLFHWAVILGAFPDPSWRFENMRIEWQMCTINLAVADLVAAVGLWMRVSWGTVIWIYAAIFEAVMHTVFRNKFGANYPLAAFHLVTMLLFIGLWVAEYRARHRY